MVLLRSSMRQHMVHPENIRHEAKERRSRAGLDSRIVAGLRVIFLLFSEGTQTYCQQRFCFAQKNESGKCLVPYRYSSSHTRPLATARRPRQKSSFRQSRHFPPAVIIYPCQGDTRAAAGSHIVYPIRRIGRMNPCLSCFFVCFSH